MFHFLGTSLALTWRRRLIITLGVQAVIVDAERHVLLVRHGYRPGWHFPGGGAEKNETVEAALRRELLEETGVVLKEAPQLVGLYAHFDVFPGDHIVLYCAQDWERAHVPAPNREIAERMFLAEKTVKNYVSNLLAKLGMSRRSEAAAYAARAAAERALKYPPENWEEPA